MILPDSYSLREKCPNTELFLVRIFLYSVGIQENTDQKQLRIWTFFTKWLLPCDWIIYLCALLFIDIVINNNWVVKNLMLKNILTIVFPDHRLRFVFQWEMFKFQKPLSKMFWGQAVLTKLQMSREAFLVIVFCCKVAVQ